MKVIEGEKLSLSGVQRTDMGKRNRNYHKLKNIQQEFLLSSHLGGYLCIASNGIPPSVSKRYDVQVNCKWPISIEKVQRKNIKIMIIKNIKVFPEKLVKSSVKHWRDV